MVIAFPSTLPKDDAVTLWSLQQQLLKEAVSQFGPRDQTKKIYQPIFRADGPVLINTPNLDGAFAALSLNAERYWPTVVYELAHETVHLLNPTVGSTNWLEEGIAVAFSIEMSASLTQHPMAPPVGSNHLTALSLLQSLPRDYRHTASTLRDGNTALSCVDVDVLSGMFPDVEPDLLI